MPDRVVSDFPLFPLGTVALPHELVPLHIFEPRYRTMVSECLERGSEFGIVWSDDEGVRAVGCAMEITDVLERMDDGRMNILTRGTRPFRIVDERHDLAYPAGTVEFLTDKAERADAKTADRRAGGLRRARPAGHRPRARRRGAGGDDRLPDGRHRRLRPATPSRACSTCAPRTPACVSSRGSSARR